MLLYVTNFCPSTAHCRNFFALLRYDEQTKLLVEIESASARTSPALTAANARQYEQQLLWLLLLLRASPINHHGPATMPLWCPTQWRIQC
jgi:hypothetical protein